MLASLSHETGWRLPLAPREKAWPLTKPGNVGPAVMLKWQVHSKALERQDTVEIFLYIARLGEYCCITNRSSSQVGRRIGRHLTTILGSRTPLIP